MDDPTNQRALQQFYQQQRIAELQSVRQRQEQQMAANETRLMAMRNQFIASTAPTSAPLQAASVGIFGRNVTQANASGVTRQSFFSTVLDAKASSLQGLSAFGIRPFYSAGFQIGSSLQNVQERAKESLRAMRGQLGTNFVDGALPDIVLRAMGRTGLGEVGERALELVDVLGGVRGSDSNRKVGRGFAIDRATRIEARLTKNIGNNVFGGSASEEQIAAFSSMAKTSLDGRQQLTIAQADKRGDDKAVDKILEAQTKLLKDIATNGGMSLESLKNIVAQNKSSGNSLNDIVRATNFANNMGQSSVVSREVLTQTALSFTAQGRSMNVSNASQFGQDQLKAINSMVSDFNAGIIDRAELFRFGGANEFEAATRVRERQIQVGQGFAQRNAATLGVLGKNVGSSLAGGMVQNIGDIGAAYGKNMFAGLNAQMDYKTNQRLAGGASMYALQQARNLAERIPTPDARSKDSLVKRFYAQGTELSYLDAAREVDVMKAQERAMDERLLKTDAYKWSNGMSPAEKSKVSGLVKGYYTGVFNRLGKDPRTMFDKNIIGKIIHEARSGRDPLSETDVADLLVKKGLNAFDDPHRKGEKYEQAYSFVKSQKYLEGALVSPETKEIVKARLARENADRKKNYQDPIVPVTGERVGIFGRRAFDRDTIGSLIDKAGLSSDELNDFIFQQLNADGDSSGLVDSFDVGESLKQEGKRNTLFSKNMMNAKEFGASRDYILQAVLNKQTAVNMEAAQRGSPDLPMIVKGWKE